MPVLIYQFIMTEALITRPWIMWELYVNIRTQWQQKPNWQPLPVETSGGGGSPRVKTSCTLCAYISILSPVGTINNWPLHPSPPHLLLLCSGNLSGGEGRGMGVGGSNVAVLRSADSKKKRKKWIPSTQWSKDCLVYIRSGEAGPPRSQRWGSTPRRAWIEEGLARWTSGWNLWVFSLDTWINDDLDFVFSVKALSGDVCFRWCISK